MITLPLWSQMQPTGRARWTNTSRNNNGITYDSSATNGRKRRVPDANSSCARPRKVRDENGTRFISLFTRSIFKDANSSIPAGLRQDIGDLLSRLAIQSESGHPLDDGGNNIGDISNETILVWIGATESGNSTARENLQQLQQQFVANASNQACGLHFLLPLAFLTMFFFL